MEIAGLARFWNSPVMIRAVTNPTIGDPDLYPTVVQFGLTSAIDFTYAIKCLTDYLNISSVRYSNFLNQFCLFCYFLNSENQ